MAYDPQDPLSSIIEERKKRANSFTRNLKSQITGRTPKEPEIPEAIANQPTVARGFTPNPNARMAPNQTDAPASVPAGVGPGERQIRPRPTGGTFNIPTGRTAPYGLTQTANKEIVSSIVEAERAAGRDINVPKPTAAPAPSAPTSITNPVAQREGAKRVGMGDVRMREQSPPPAEPGSSPGLMTRGVQQPGLGQVGVNAPTNVPPYLSGDRAALAAMERMRPQRPQQATPSAAQPAAATPSAAQPAVQPPAATPAMAQPEQAMIGPERQPNRARIDQLRAQIASEQQAMLAARRARGGSFREDTAPLERIAGMRQELAQYERAATPGQPIRVKTPEENLATEQSLARQASDIMARDLGADNIPAVSGQPLRGSAEDLRRQVATMPAGPERDAMAEQLRSLQYQQQQQAARAGALPAGAVGPQPMGASVELAEQMMGEARARTQRQQEAAPRVAARQQELADVAMREGERLTGKRQDVEQQRADFARATREATLAEISRPEREFGLTQKKFESEINNINSMISSRDAASQLAQKRLEFDQLQDTNRQTWMKAAFDYANDPNNPEFKKKVAEASKMASEAAVIDFELKRRMGMADKGMSPQEIEQRQIVENSTLDRLGLRKQDGSGLMQSAIVEGSKLGAEIGGADGRSYVGSMFTGNAEGGIKAVMVLDSFANAMEQLNKTNPELTKIMVNEFLGSLPSSMGRNLEGTDFSTPAKLLAVPSLPFLGGIPLAQMTNQKDKEFVMRGFNKFRDTMTRLGGLESTQQGSFVGPPTNQ